jgi:hypothetical protein
MANTCTFIISYRSELGPIDESLHGIPFDISYSAGTAWAETFLANILGEY